MPGVSAYRGDRKVANIQGFLIPERRCFVCWDPGTNLVELSLKMKRHCCNSEASTEITLPIFPAIFLTVLLYSFVYVFSLNFPCILRLMAICLSITVSSRIGLPSGDVRRGRWIKTRRHQSDDDNPVSWIPKYSRSCVVGSTRSDSILFRIVCKASFTFNWSVLKFQLEGPMIDGATFSASFKLKYQLNWDFRWIARDEESNTAVKLLVLFSQGFKESTFHLHPSLNWKSTGHGSYNPFFNTKSIKWSVRWRGALISLTKIG